MMIVSPLGDNMKNCEIIVFAGFLLESPQVHLHIFRRFGSMLIMNAVSL